eukprot:jgi/Chlat1/3380/Chrsp23S03810
MSVEQGRRFAWLLPAEATGLARADEADQSIALFAGKSRVIGRKEVAHGDSRVSREHASVAVSEAGVVVLRTLGQNPVVVAGERLAQGRTAELKHGDEFELVTEPAAGMQPCNGTSSVPKPGEDGLSYRLLRTRNVPDTANIGSCTINDLIQGDIQWAILTDYEVDLEWLLPACPTLNRIPFVLLVHGESREDLLRARCPPNIALYKPPLPIAWGTHHTKMMLLMYKHGIRVVVHTANLVNSDFNNKTQGVWVQDFPLKSTTGSKPASLFEDDLLFYLEALKWRPPAAVPGGVSANIAALRQYDYSCAKVCLIPSLPGYHTAKTMHRLGHMKLRAVLAAEKLPSDFSGSPLVYQCSSMGSLDEKWMKEFAHSLNAGKSDNGRPLAPGNFSIVWPTVQEVRCSIEGYRAGGSIPGPKKNVERPFLMQKYCTWSDAARPHPLTRTHAMPHIKSYARYSGNRLAWFLLTSSNLSKAAWGALQKNGQQLMIRSYEMGVLFLPSLLTKYAHVHFSCTNLAFSIPRPLAEEQPAQLQLKAVSSANEVEAAAKPGGTGDQVVLLPVPYALPPRPYSPTDKPWVVDGQFSAPDDFGLTWPPLML